MSQYFPPYFNPYGYTRDVNVKIDLNEYAKKDDLKKITQILVILLQKLNYLMK